MSENKSIHSSGAALHRSAELCFPSSDISRWLLIFRKLSKKRSSMSSRAPPKEVGRSYRERLLSRVPVLMQAPDFPCSLFVESSNIHREFILARDALATIKARLLAGERSESLRQELIFKSTELCVLAGLERDLNDAILTALPQKVPDSPTETIQTDILRELVDLFLNGESVLVDPPFGPLCGKIPLHPTQHIPERTFAGHWNDGAFDLVLVLERTSNGMYEVCGAVPPVLSVGKCTATRGSLALFPSCLPRGLDPACDFAVGDAVVAICAADDCRVRQGVVVATPGSRGEGYRVQFDGWPDVELVRDHWVTAIEGGSPSV
jgi:hypothetical protein